MKRFLIGLTTAVIAIATWQQIEITIGHNEGKPSSGRTFSSEDYYHTVDAYLAHLKDPSEVHAQQTDGRLVELGHDDGSGYPLQNITAGAQIGAGNTAVCTTGHVCSDSNGDISIVVGTTVSGTSGVLANLAFAQTWQTNLENCVLAPSNLNAVGTVVYMTAHETTAPSLSADVSIGTVALAASKTYRYSYVCKR
jgi:hypothetical protein